MKPKTRQLIDGYCLAAIPPAPLSALEFARQYVKLPMSARCESFDDSVTPWTREPIERLSDPATKYLTFIKPVQAGGSTVGEIALCYWIYLQKKGDIFYNWEDDEKAKERWVKRIDRILRSCAPVKRIIDGLERHKYQKCLVAFPRLSLTVQGVYNATNLDSDSVRLLINEEIHNWRPGLLEKAYRRKTAFPNFFSLQISNAGRAGDQLHAAFEEGTQQVWEVKCPGCGKYHEMHTHWNDARPELGGLRYDADKARAANGEYNYALIAPTVRYQFPCGFLVFDSPRERRALSLSGRYSEPKNPDAHLSNRSYILDAVAVDYIPWIELIMEKHKALRAMKYGDLEAWLKYLRERECIFTDDNSRPMIPTLVVSQKKKDRAGLENRVARFAALDRQQGSISKGEIPHWWMVIRDVDAAANSLLVWEGKCETDEEALDVLNRHCVLPRHVVCDSGDDTTHVYRFCIRNGFNAIKGGTKPLFPHPDGGMRIFSQENFLWKLLNMRGPTKPEGQEVDEPMFWLYSKPGIRDRLAWLRTSNVVKWEVPADVSNDYREHMEAEELQSRRTSDGYQRNVWVQVRRRNDLFVCECYIAMLMEMAGLIGGAIGPTDTAESESESSSE